MAEGEGEAKMTDIDPNEVHECPYVGARPLGIVQAHWSIEKYYFDFVQSIYALTDRQYVTREEILEVLRSPAYDKPEPPSCDCGHEFSADPKIWHLSSCKYREYFE
jgi:hypothetical protein